MILRLTYLTSVFSLAAAARTKTVYVKSGSSSTSMSTPSPSGSKSGKGTTPGTKSVKIPGAKSNKAGAEYFIAPFSCPKSCISAQDYALSNHLLDDAVSECDAGDDYQKWKVHQSGGFLKFESAAQYDEGMCLAVVHQDPTHESNLGSFILWYGFNPGSTLGSYLTLGKTPIWPLSSELSEDDVDEMCNGHLGLADCDHPGSYWYNTGGQYLSALCWSEGVSAAMTTDCTDLGVADSSTSDLTTSETFMLLESD